MGRGGCLCVHVRTCSIVAFSPSVRLILEPADHPARAKVITGTLSRNCLRAGGSVLMQPKPARLHCWSHLYTPYQRSLCKWPRCVCDVLWGLCPSLQLQLQLHPLRQLPRRRSASLQVAPSLPAACPGFQGLEHLNSWDHHYLRLHLGLGLAQRQAHHWQAHHWHAACLQLHPARSSRYPRWTRDLPQEEAPHQPFDPSNVGAALCWYAHGVLAPRKRSRL